MSSSSSSEQDTALMDFYDYVESLLIDYKEIKSATNNFADENLIAESTSFKVYKGQLLDSDSGELINIVARKCLDLSVMHNEIMMSNNLKHNNIISIFKLTTKNDEVIIINKHEVNGSLNKHLSGSTLTWIQRLHICVRVAHALRYIHNLQDDMCVIHGNIKSSHILLDHNWEPKLKGFQFATRGKRHHLRPTSKYNGSLEYMDPEYERTGGLTHKSDVFSFGVVLFEVLFGRKADGENSDFARLARSHYEARTLDAMINSDLRKQMDEHSLKIFSDTAYPCLKDGRALRPDMDQIFKKLREAFELQQIHESYVRSSNHLKGKNMDHLRIPLSDIESATNNFSTNRIGAGGYGTVYKAELDIFDDTISSVPEGKNKDDFLKKRRTVAVKRLERKQGEVRGFFTEIEMLTNCKHRNIVSLLGFCEEGPERILVYEHVSNGSLSDYFEKFNNTKRLSWAQRLQICLDIAHGLEYLHSSTEEKPMIIHRDIKSDNILLDNNWVAKIADFGLSRLHAANQEANTINTGTIAGTEVYLDPEYMETGRLKKESDIYSFGVVLFELVSGKLAYDRSYSINNEKGLLSIVHKCFNERTLKKVIDPNLKEASGGIRILDDRLDKKSLDTFLDIAYQCLAHRQDRRPTMKVIINELDIALIYQENRSDGFHISLKDITLATNNFSDDKCVGEGRYWKQYEGEIPLENTLTTVIVKRWDKNSSQACHQYFTELKVLSKRKHENVVALVGLCNECGERIIVYEHASNGHLDKHLGDMSLTWIKRLKICVGIATGLKFLHEDAKMIHRDIKSSSILLNSDWEPKICNFELSSKTQEWLKVEHATDNAYGSLVYLDPLHEKQGGLDDRSDVYSLGVILMEILCGRLAWGKGCKDHFESLGPLAKRRYKEGKLDELVFEGIKEQISPQAFTTFASIAVSCLESYYRPRASEVVIRLEKALEIQENRRDGFLISIKDINLATKNFSDDKCIRAGRYWKQYEGEIPLENTLTTVTVKRWDKESHQAHHQFLTELKVVSENKHENIVALVALCNESGERIIVYEHATSGTLDKHLDDVNLTWPKRLKICVGIATGLKFLHEHADMIHRDIKSSSIQLDSDWEPKICNFELSSKIQEWLKAEHATDNAYGSLGYLDPLHEEQGYLDKDSDVYSLGVVLMEILCGRLAWGEGCDQDHSESLGPLAERRFREGKLDGLVFKGIKEQVFSLSFTTFARISVRCLDKRYYMRPTASEVVIRLEKALELQERYEKLRISLEDIKLGTQNFSDAKVNGEGRYWKQYKGDLPHSNGHTTVVVKRFDTACDEGSNQFIVESEALLEYEHENIIRVAGYCDEVNEKIIVYEHASKGRLSEHLKDTSLTWLKRLKICIDVVTGLRFLHADDVFDKDVMVHGNIKSGSILIDSEWKAKLSNLELLRKESNPCETSESEEETEAEEILEETEPQDISEGETMSDIYSLGEVFMEILCGRLAWEEGCKYHSQSLGPLAKRRYEKGDIHQLVFEGIKKQIYKKSLTTFTDIAIRCLDYDNWGRPIARDVIKELQKALEYQEDYETWEPKLPRDYEEVLHFSKIDKMEKFKDIYDTLCKGFHLREREVHFSLGSKGEKTYMVSPALFSYKNRRALKWRHVPQSRFQKVAKMLNLSELNIHINMRTPFLSSGANYAVHLIFKFCDPRMSSKKPSYVKLTYKMGGEIFHAYFAIWRDEDWMKIELCRFLKHKEYTNFEILLEGFSQNYCGSGAIYVEGIEFQSIDNLKQEDSEKTMAIQQQLPTYSEKRSGNDYEGWELFSLNEINVKKHLMLSAMEVLYDCSNVEPFHSEPSAKSRNAHCRLQFQRSHLHLRRSHMHLRRSHLHLRRTTCASGDLAAPPETGTRFQEVIELLPQQVFGIKSKIRSRMLSPDTDYTCYLVFKLSEKCHGLHCPVRVRNVLQWKNKDTGLVCFRPPSAWDLLVTPRVRKIREDGWMEVSVWKFNSTSALRNDRIPMHLKLITYEGTMSGLIVRGLEIRPMQE